MLEVQEERDKLAHSRSDGMLAAGRDAGDYWAAAVRTVEEANW